MKVFCQVRNRALGYLRVASFLLLGSGTQPYCSALCLPDCCSLPPYQPNPGYACCPPPSYCVQNVVVGSAQDVDKDKSSCCEPQTNDQCCSYLPQDVTTYCCREQRKCCEDDPAILRRLLAALQCQCQSQNQCQKRVDSCCRSYDPSSLYSSSGLRSLSDPSLSSSGFGSFSDLGYSSSALRSLIDPSLAYSSSGMLSFSDPSSLVSSSSSLRSLLDPYILSQITDPQSCCQNYCDPCCDPCCNPNPCVTTCSPCVTACNPCRLQRQPCCKKTQRRVILIDSPTSCYV